MRISRTNDSRFTIIRVEPAREKLQLFLKDDNGKTFKRFDRLASWLQKRNERLVFAMNAGMYHPGYAPVGLLIQNRKQVSALNLQPGKGNFFLKPNGVFLVAGSGPRVIESSEFTDIRTPVLLATQSGPLLVRQGKIHRAFDPNSSSRLIRNGVGVSGKTALFVISEQPVNLYEFAAFFRDSLGCPNALYLDGSVSSLYAPQIKRNDFKRDLGPIIGVLG